MGKLLRNLIVVLALIGVAWPQAQPKPAPPDDAGDHACDQPWHMRRGLLPQQQRRLCSLSG